MDARSIILFQSFKLHLQMNTLGNEQDGCKTLEYAWPFPKVKLKSEHGSAMECIHCCGRSMCRFFSKRFSDIYTAIPTKATLLYRQAAPCEACSVQIKAGAAWCVTGWQGWQVWQGWQGWNLLWSFWNLQSCKVLFSSFAAALYSDLSITLVQSLRELRFFDAQVSVNSQFL